MAAGKSGLGEDHWERRRTPSSEVPWAPLWGHGPGGGIHNPQKFESGFSDPRRTLGFHPLREAQSVCFRISQIFKFALLELLARTAVNGNGTHTWPSSTVRWLAPHPECVQLVLGKEKVTYFLCFQWQDNLLSEPGTSEKGKGLY